MSAESMVIDEELVSHSACYSTLLNEWEQKAPPNRLLSLPPFLFHIIFGDYLPLVDVARVDNAICNRRDRNKFLANLNNLTTEDNLEELNSYRSSKFHLFHRWLYQRHINYRHIILGCTNTQESLIRTIFPQNKLELIRRLDIGRDFDKQLSKVVTCTNTKSLRLLISDEALFQDLNFYDRIVAFTSAFSKLEYVMFDIFAVNDAVVTAVVSRNPGLKEIHFAHCLNMTDEAAIAIGRHCPQLRKLSWHNMDLITDVAFCQLIEGCPNLEYVHMLTAVEALGETDNIVPTLTNRTLSAFATYTKNLKVLSIQLCFDTPNLEQGLRSVAEGCLMLEELYIEMGRGYGAGTTAITDAVLVAFAEARPAVQVLSLSGLDVLTDAALSVIGSYCVKLRELYIKKLPHVTGLGFSTFVNVESLVQIRIGSCDISNDSLLLLAQASPGLEVLVIESCPKITDAGIYHVASHLSQLQFFALAALRGIDTSDSIIEVCRRNVRLTIPGIKLVNLHTTITTFDNTLPTFPFDNYFVSRTLIQPELMGTLHSITAGRLPMSPHIADVVRRYAFHIDSYDQVLMSNLH